MIRPLALASLTSVVLAIVAPTAAQTVEVTPFVGYQFGGELDELGDEPIRRDLDSSPTWGLLVDVEVTHDTQVEIFYGSLGAELDRGIGDAFDVDEEILQIGAVREYDHGRPIIPYVGLTLGATRFEIGDDNDTRFSGAIALGAKMLVSDNLGFRFDGRLFGSSTNSSTIGCVDGVCIGDPDTSVIWQYSINAGIIVRFGR
jgi:hypothetical protein